MQPIAARFVRYQDSGRSHDLSDEVSRTNQELLDAAIDAGADESLVEIDLRLRPFGSKGPLATSLDAFREYYRHGGQAAIRSGNGTEGTEVELVMPRSEPA